MGFETLTKVAGAFEQELKRALASTKQLFLFDHPSLIHEAGGYHAIYYNLCGRNGRLLYEMEASQLTEQSLVDALAQDAPEHITAGRQQSAHSNYRLLTDLVDSKRDGLICIHNGQDLSTNGLHTLARLRNHIRRNNQGWQIIIFANTRELSNLALVQLNIDATYPESMASTEWLEGDDPQFSRALELFPRYAQRAAIGVSLFIMATLIYWKLNLIL